MRTFLIIAALAVTLFQAQAQNQRTIDSLHTLLNSPIADSLRVNILLDGLALEYYLSDPAKAMEYCRQAKEISERINFADGMSSAYGWLAFLYEQQGEITRAIEYNQQSLRLLRKTGNKKQEATVLNNLGAIYKDRGNIDEALRYYHASLSIRQKLNDSTGMASTYNNLGIIYSNQGNVEEALNYYYRSLKLEEDLDNKDGISTSLHNIGLVYKDQGDLIEAMKAYRRALHLNIINNDKYSMGYSYNAIGGIYELRDSLGQALEYYSKAYDIRAELGDKQGMAYSLRNIGGIYEKLEKPGYTDYYNKSLVIFKEMDDMWGMVTVMIKLGNDYLRQHDIHQAQMMADSAFLLAKSLGYPTEIRDVARLLQLIYKEQSKWKEALVMNDLYHMMRDSVSNINNRKETFRQQFRYEFEKKETALKAEQDKKNALAAIELKRQKTEKNAYLGGFSLVFIFSILLYNRFRITTKQKQIIEKARNQLSETLDQLKNTQEQLIEHEKMAAFGTMATRMAHEIQNPLNFVNNFSEMSEELIEEISGEVNTESKHEILKMLKENLQKINDHGKRAQHIVRSLQDHVNAGTTIEFFKEG